MIPTDTVAHWIFLAMLVAAGATWAAWRLWFRRDDRAHHLAAGIADERRTEADEPTVEFLAVDPPVDRAYIPDVHPDRTVERYPLVPGGWIEFRGGLVHVRCLGPKLLSDVPPCAGCAVHLDHVLTGAS